jgi:hypothetical protein
MPIPSDQALTVSQKNQEKNKQEAIAEGEPEELVFAQANRLPEPLCGAFMPTEHRMRNANYVSTTTPQRRMNARPSIWL